MLTAGNEADAKAPALDLVGLRKRTAHDDGLLRLVVGIFLEECPAWVAGIEAAVRQRDAATVQAVAHRLGGTAATVGAMRTSESAFLLEKAARAGSVSDLERLLPDLTAAADEAAQRLRELTAALPG